MSGPLRSLLIGDVSHYPSEFIFGVAQGMTLLGHWHNVVDIRMPVETIWQKIEQTQPDVLWGHMLLWAPGEITATLLNMCDEAKRRWGTRVLIHDGDARVATRYPHDVSHAVDLALCNHTASRSEWKIPCLRWPYGAFVQTALAEPVYDFTGDLVFAGRLGHSVMYVDRTRMIEQLGVRLGDALLVFPNEHVKHTLFRTAELAVSAQAVLGWGRSESPGWTDVRVFQYPGAGGILLHDDATEWLTPWTDYVPVAKRGDVDAVLDALAFAKTLGPTFRERVHARIQREHSMLVRVQQALEAVGL